MELSYIFSKESFSYISGNRNPEKIIYISGNGTFLVSGNGNPKKLLIFPETEFSKLEK